MRATVRTTIATWGGDRGRQTQKWEGGGQLEVEFGGGKGGEGGVVCFAADCALGGGCLQEGG